jgi:hypothetical protein
MMRVATRPELRVTLVCLPPDTDRGALVLTKVHAGDSRPLRLDPSGAQSVKSERRLIPWIVTRRVREQKDRRIIYTFSTAPALKFPYRASGPGCFLDFCGCEARYG